MLALVTLLIFAAIALGLALLLFAVVDRAEVRANLRQLKQYEVVPLREQRLLESVRERAIAPTLHVAMRLARKVTPQGQIEKVQRNLMIAGSPPNLDIDLYLALKLIGAISIVPIRWLVVNFVPIDGSFETWFATVAIWAAIFMLPDVSLKRLMEARKKAILHQLPDLLDLLVVSVEAGLGFEQAIDRTIVNMPGVLSEEFFRMLQETRVGVSRHEALQALEVRTDVPELRSFITAMIQADAFGVSITRVLRSQASDIRVKRRQRVEEEAHKMPVTMLFPMILCIFPSLFVVVLGPAAINIIENFPK